MSKLFEPPGFVAKGPDRNNRLPWAGWVVGITSVVAFVTLVTLAVVRL